MISLDHMTFEDHGQKGQVALDICFYKNNMQLTQWISRIILRQFL